MTQPYIRFDKVTKAYGDFIVVEDLYLDIAKGEFVSLLGPSGSGKTTILMMLAGFEPPTRGAVIVDEKRIDQLPPHRRNMGVVFQSYALFPHMTVADNVAFPLEMRGVPKANRKQLVDRALDMVQLGTMADRKPSQLSGGQQQRVALARALVFEPAVVLMDEPLGALDKQLREQMQLDIRDLHKRLGLTIIFVTHDQSEALTMSDRIAVFNKGRIEQIGTPNEIYDHPTTRFVADFIGETNLLDGAIETSDANGLIVALPGNKRIRVAAGSGEATGAAVTVSLRPEKIRLNSDAGSENSLPVTILDSVYHGDHLRMVLDAQGTRLIAKADRRFGDLQPGSKAIASFDAADCWLVRS
ncbi:ABC transporter ATP-binding protein [Tianweitania sp. BSSL-BM11]|uniref:Spermidine/putrescine import ATP-binding protein PotA n=1 Tax=Tianweitania aestuarii TaxID=2814886 RepID=A0ABS5RRC4_9HYPH|nr:ABC transporter ATP-binding protein [Tianweitania aestuarii]MBS9719608.1 ABC transporter ATP-binding protein [Tianweitania aestuarii]